MSIREQDPGKYEDINGRNECISCFGYVSNRNFKLQLRLYGDRI
jgi:hypothetical protein